MKKDVNEESVSRSQQRLMGQAYGVRIFRDSGEKRGLDPQKIDPKYRHLIVSKSKQMTKKQLKDFAETQHKDLPETVEEEAIKDIFFKLSPDSKYDKKREPQRKLQNLVDYREWIKNNK